MRPRRSCSTLLFVAAAVGFATPLAARQGPSHALQERIETVFRGAGPGPRFGIVVTTLDGTELVAIGANQRFIPASNTKIFTTAAAFDALTGLNAPDVAGGTRVRLAPARRGLPDVVLEGRGDARLSSAADCVTNCLAALADVVSGKVRTVRDVIGDDSLFPDQRWSPGMSWNNIPTKSGTAVSALTLDDNELALRVVPTSPGQAPRLEHLPYYSVDNAAVTVATGPTELSIERVPGSTVVRLSGAIAADSAGERLALGIDDPAHYAAWRFKSLLEARGVRVTGRVIARHRPPPGPSTGQIGGSPAISDGKAGGSLARLVPPPLADDLTVINKVSQNLHAELMLRRLGRQRASGSIEDGVKVVQNMLDRAGVPRWSYDLSDGSGMSTYNRVAPHGMVILLRWIATQRWGAAWRATLPVGGIDGTLAKRFRGTPLHGRVFAKTGTLNATNALSGYILARSGRTLVFSAFANDVPGGGSASGLLDAALEIIAEEN